MLPARWSGASRRVGMGMVALWAVLASVVPAAEPVAVVAISPLQELFGDIQYVANTVGFPEAGQMVVAMAGPYAQGLDNQRPLGLAVHIDPQLQSVQPLAFLPVTNFQATLNLLQQQFGPPQDAGNGVQEIQGPQSVFFKEQNGWVFLAPSAEGLQDLPADPAALIADLDRQYDIAARVYVQNLPQSLRDTVLNQMKEGMRMGMQRREEESDEQYQLRQRMAQVQVEQLEQLVGDLESLTVGVNIDQQAKLISFGVTTLGMAGGKLAAQSELLKNTSTEFGGFLHPDAAITMLAAAQVPSDQVEQSATTFEVLRQNALEQIENDKSLPDQAARDAAKELLNQVMDVLVATVRSGRMDIAGSVILNPDAVHLVAAAHVADGQAIEQALQRLNKLAAREEGFPGIQFNVDRQGNARFHQVAFPIPEEEAEARRIFGDQLNVAVGIAPTSVYLAAGSGAIDQLKEAIAGSQSSAGPLKTASQVRLSVEKILKFVASVDPNQQPALQAAVQAVSQTSGDDRVTLEGQAIDRGIHYHITVDEGVLRAIGAAVRSGQGQP